MHDKTRIAISVRRHLSIQFRFPPFLLSSSLSVCLCVCVSFCASVSLRQAHSCVAAPAFVASFIRLCHCTLFRSGAPKKAQRSIDGPIHLDLIAFLPHSSSLSFVFPFHSMLPSSLVHFFFLLPSPQPAETEKQKKKDDKKSSTNLTCFPGFFVPSCSHGLSLSLSLYFP